MQVDDDPPRLLGPPRGGVFALYKPAGLRVHPGAQDGAPDLVGWAWATLGADLHPVHRLDAETSGVVLCAEDPARRAALGALFAEGLVEKRYLALVHGSPHAKGVIRRALQDARRGHPLEAVTRFRKVEQLGGFALLSVRPETGRKHQIRRHLQGLGHPVVGDERYPPRRFRRVPGWPGRLWLHAERVALPDGEIFEAPLPATLEAHLALLRAGAGAHP